MITASQSIIRSQRSMETTCEGGWHKEAVEPEHAVQGNKLPTSTYPSDSSTYLHKKTRFSYVRTVLVEWHPIFNTKLSTNKQIFNQRPTSYAYNSYQLIHAGLPTISCSLPARASQRSGFPLAHPRPSACRLTQQTAVSTGGLERTDSHERVSAFKW